MRELMIYAKKLIKKYSIFYTIFKGKGHGQQKAKPDSVGKRIQDASVTAVLGLITAALGRESWFARNGNL